MGQFFARRVWTRQPQSPIPADEGDSILTGIVEIIVPVWKFSAIQNIEGTLNGTLIETRPGLSGSARVQTTENASSWDSYAGSWANIAAPFTLLGFYRLTALPTTTTRLCGTGGVSVGYQFRASTTNFLGLTSGSAANAQVIGSAVHTRPKIDVLTRQGTTTEYWENGVSSGTASGANTYAVGTQPFLVGNSGGTSARAEHYLYALWNRVLPPAEIISLSQNPWQIFMPLQRNIWVPVSAGSNTSVTPDVGTITLTGYAPAVDRTQSATPDVGQITLTGYAPTVAQSVNRAVTPDVGQITITGYAPTVTQVAGTNVTPDVGTITITGYAPAVDRTASATPDVGQITITGYAPTVSQASASNIADPDTGTITITGYAPTVTQGGAKVGGDEAGDWVKEKKRKKTDIYAEQTVARKQAVLDAFHGLLDPETPEPVVIEAKSVVESTPLPDLDREKVQKLLKLWQDEVARREEDDELVMMML